MILLGGKATLNFCFKGIVFLCLSACTCLERPGSHTPQIIDTDQINLIMFESCSPSEGENGKRKMIPCVKEHCVDFSCFPNTPDMDGVKSNEVFSNLSLDDL